MRAIGLKAIFVAAGIAVPAAGQAQDAADFARELASPLAAIISVPLQLEHDDNIGINGRSVAPLV